MEIFSGLDAFIWQSYTENNCNAYCITGEKSILIDPGHKHLLDHVEQGLRAINLSWDIIDVVIITHGHPDHMESVGQLDKRTLLAMNKEEYVFIREIAGHYFQIPEPDFFLGAGDLAIGGNHFEVLITPGHSPGSICLYWPDRKALFTGDLAFSQGIGRTDLPGGSGYSLKRASSASQHSMLSICCPDMEILSSAKRLCRITSVSLNSSGSITSNSLLKNAILNRLL